MKVTNPWGVPNQFILSTPEARYFQSYESIIVKIDCDDDGKRQIVLDEKYWNYSKTTSKYRNSFLGETTAEIKAKIASGEYQLADLNQEKG